MKYCLMDGFFDRIDAVETAYVMTLRPMESSRKRPWSRKPIEGEFRKDLLFVGGSLKIALKPDALHYFDATTQARI